MAKTRSSNHGKQQKKIVTVHGYKGATRKGSPSLILNVSGDNDEYNRI